MLFSVASLLCSLPVRRREGFLLLQRGLAATTTTTSTTVPPPSPGESATVHNGLNCAHALDKSHETSSFQSILSLDVTTLQGIGPKHQEQLHTLRLKTVEQLANCKFYHLAKAITTLADTEETGGRLDGTAMNIDKGVDKAYESQSFTELVEAPVAALQGISDEAGDVWKHLGVRTVGDLARFKYCHWAEALQTAAKFEVATVAEAEKK